MDLSPRHSRKSPNATLSSQSAEIHRLPISMNSDVLLMQPRHLTVFATCKNSRSINLNTWTPIPDLALPSPRSSKFRSRLLQLRRCQPSRTRRHKTRNTKEQPHQPIESSGSHQLHD